MQSEHQRNLFEEAASFGIRCGFTIPIHDKTGPIAAVSFATDGRRNDLERSTRRYATVLRVIAMYFHAHARPTLQCARSVAGVLLSPRELECLEWSSLGKSAGDIGIILDIVFEDRGFSPGQCPRQTRSSHYSTGGRSASQIQITKIGVFAVLVYMCNCTGARDLAALLYCKMRSTRQQ
ncbi:autoinducer binding domain-containing protein [Bradyrhizobium sp. Ec3.3]|uniref:autoinducer binding domain-containing protein n=1 Tax=Bradyrhizobium sp. Ec3.3 TaxID=189753 RepID=UPI001FD98FB2|nr:autoinducer binding domain-containing protein [Bradyrhizobium sp. Ec3.3]